MSKAARRRPSNFSAASESRRTRSAWAESRRSHAIPPPPRTASSALRKCPPPASPILSCASRSAPSTGATCSRSSRARSTASERAENLPAYKFSGAALRDGLDALAMVFGFHQARLLDELVIGLCFDGLRQPAADGRPGRKDCQRRVLGDFARKRRCGGAQLVLIGQDIGKADCDRFFAANPPPRQEHQAGLLPSDESRQRIGQSESRMDSYFHE